MGGVTSTSWRSEDGEEEDDPAGDPGIRWGDPTEGGGSVPGLGFRLAGGGLCSGSDELDMHSITLPRQTPSLSNGFDPTAALEPFEGFSKLFRMHSWTRWACFQITSWISTPVLLTFVIRQCLLTWSKLWLRVETDSLCRDLPGMSWYPSALSTCFCFVNSCLPIILLKPHMSLLLPRLIMTSSTLIGPCAVRLGHNLLLKVRLAPEDRVKLLEIQSEQVPGSSTYLCLCPSDQASC